MSCDDRIQDLSQTPPPLPPVDNPHCKGCIELAHRVNRLIGLCRAVAKEGRRTVYFAVATALAFIAASAYYSHRVRELEHDVYEYKFALATKELRCRERERQLEAAEWDLNLTKWKLHLAETKNHRLEQELRRDKRVPLPLPPGPEMPVGECIILGDPLFKKRP